MADPICDGWVDFADGGDFAVDVGAVGTVGGFEAIPPGARCQSIEGRMKERNRRLQS